MTSNLDQTLLERACQYGSFEDVANRTARIYHHMVFKAPQFATQQDRSLYYEALHMIAMKVARLVNGQINHADSWRDIAGYAMLVYNQIEQEAVSASARTGNAKQQQEAKASKSVFSDKAVIDAMEAEIGEISVEAMT